MRLPVLLIAMSVTIVTVNSVSGAENDRRRPGQARVGDQARPGMRGQNPEQMVKFLMQRFDADGDQKLDVQELTKLMTALRERGQAGQRPGFGQRPGAKGNANQQRRGLGEKPARAGGDKPKRPALEE